MSTPCRPPLSVGHWDGARWLLDIGAVSFQPWHGLTTVVIPSSRISKQEKAAYLRTPIVMRRLLEMLSETMLLWHRNQGLGTISSFPLSSPPKADHLPRLGWPPKPPRDTRGLVQVGTRGDIPFLHGNWVHEKAIGDSHSLSYDTGWTNDRVLNGWLLSNLCIWPNEAISSNL